MQSLLVSIIGTQVMDEMKEERLGEGGITAVERNEKANEGISTEISLSETLDRVLGSACTNVSELSTSPSLKTVFCLNPILLNAKPFKHLLDGWPACLT